MLTVLAGARYSLYLGRIDLWGSAHFGYGSVSQSLVNKNNATDKSDSSEDGFGLDFGIGANMADESSLKFAVDVNVNLTATRAAESNG